MTLRQILTDRINVALALTRATDAVVDGATSLSLDSAEDREKLKRLLGDAIYDAVREPETMRKPTIYEALRDKLGREPTHAEVTADVRRIIRESHDEMALRGELPHQRCRR